jgi:ankyrin repeat protein
VRATDENQQTVLHHAARAGGDALCFEMLLQSYAASTSEPGNPGAAEAAETAETASVAEVRAEAPETGIDRVRNHTDTHSHSRTHVHTEDGVRVASPTSAHARPLAARRSVGARTTR